MGFHSRAGHLEYGPAVGMILPAWFDLLEEISLIKKFSSKNSVLL